jgi:hypothetical protein
VGTCEWVVISQDSRGDVIFNGLCGSVVSKEGVKREVQMQRGEQRTNLRMTNFFFSRKVN